MTAQLQLVPRKPVKAKAKKVVPSSLLPIQRRQIVDSFRAGRHVKQIAAEHQCSYYLVIELVLRDQRGGWVNEIDIRRQVRLGEAA